MPRFPSIGAAILPALCAVVLAASPVIGQDVYRLDDESDAWELLETPEPGTPAGQLADARRALVAGEPRMAAALATNWIDRYPRHPLLAEAYLIRADALFAQREHYKALFDYEYIARNFPGSEAFTVALERELEIARLFADGMRRKLWGMRIIRADDEAEELFIRIQERMPGSRLAEEAGIELGDFYFNRQRMELAAEAYALFLENYPNSDQVSKARRRLIYSNLAMFRGPRYDATGLYEARARLENLFVVEPATAQQVGAEGLIRHIDEQEALKLLETARWYLRIKDPISAERFIRRIVLEHPQTLTAREAIDLIGEILPQLSVHVLADAPDYESLRRSMLGLANEGE